MQPHVNGNLQQTSEKSVKGGVKTDNANGPDNHRFLFPLSQQMLVRSQSSSFLEESVIVCVLRVCPSPAPWSLLARLHARSHACTYTYLLSLTHHPLRWLIGLRGAVA